MTEKEMMMKVGRTLLERVEVVNSEFKDKQQLKFLGRAPGDVTVWVDRRVMEADIRIGVGSILPHPAVGWSGGGKILYPGVTGEETVTQFHLRHGSTPRNMFGEDDCPVRREMEQWVDTVGLDFIINAVVTPKKEIYQVVAGHYVEAHRSGVNYAKEIYQVQAPEPVDIVVVSSAPADSDLWQAGKGILAGDHLLKDGGSLILVSPCHEGIGPHPQVVKTCSSTDPDSVLRKALEEGKADILGLAVGATVGRLRKRLKLQMVTSGLTSQQVKEAGLTHYNSVEAALKEAFERHGDKAKVAILPYGGETFPIIRKKRI